MVPFALADRDKVFDYYEIPALLPWSTNGSSNRSKY
jgi:hypothetical protein